MKLRVTNEQHSKCHTGRCGGQGSQTAFLGEMVLNLSWIFSRRAGGRKGKEVGIFMGAIARVSLAPWKMGHIGQGVRLRMASNVTPRT